MPNLVKWVKDTLGRNDCKMFIEEYIKKYDEIVKSVLPDPPRRREPGMYFVNFIDTCKDCLLTNKHYYHYGRDSNTCRQLGGPGPTLAYSLLLKYIVHNAESYNKDDARKIHELLFWFEQQSVTYLMVIPLDKTCESRFNKYNISPLYHGEKDGTLSYCTRNGIPFTNGMEISNTRVNALLNKIHDLGHDADAQGPDGGKKRTKIKIHTIRRTRRRRISTKRRRTTRR
jgi:hypothetical protein